MNQIRRELDIAASPETIFALLTDVDRLPDWSTITLETHDPSPGRLKKGDTFTQTLRVLGRTFQSDWRVIELDAPRRIAYEATGPAGAQLRMRQAVRAREAGSTITFDVEYELPGGFLGDLAELVAGPRNERELEHSMHNLKDLAEASQ